MLEAGKTLLPKVAALWSGDWSAYSSQSEADLALCSYFAWLTGRDSARVNAAGVAKPARMYDLRSTFTSNALAAGITVYELAWIMGTSVSMIEAHDGARLDTAHCLAGMGVLVVVDADDPFGVYWDPERYQYERDGQSR